MPLFFCSNSHMKTRELFFLVFSAIFFFVGTIVVSQSNLIVKEEKYLNPPPELVEHFHFGFADSVADSLWLRWIQDSDYCQTYLSPVQVVDPPIAPQDSLLANPRHRICDNSWSFKMLDAVTKLSPKFEMPYLTGAVSLSVLVEDYEGATVIFDRAINNFPDDWRMLYRASYHFLYDKNDLPKAADLLIRAGRTGGPVWLPSLAARLYDREGQLELGIDTLKSYRQNLKDEHQIKFIEARIAELEGRLRNQQQK